MPVEYTRAFVTWAVTKEGLKSSTVQSYVSSLKTAHVIGNYKCQNFSSDPCIKMALKGAENMYQIFNTPKADRLPMNIHLLDILGDRISALGWSVLSKQVLWTACAISFFTSCRMGELLPFHEKLFDQKTTLLWGNVKFISDNEILIRIPYSKTKGFKGKLLDIYPLPDDRKCPVAALVMLKKLAIREGSFGAASPVFSFKSGKNLTKLTMNKVLSELLKDFCDENHKITSHSFPAAIPSLLASHPDQYSTAELKDWGNWESDSFKLYTKTERDRKRVI